MTQIHIIFTEPTVRASPGSTSQRDLLCINPLLIGIDIYIYICIQMYTYTYNVYIYKSTEIYLYIREHISRLALQIGEKKKNKVEITHPHKADNYTVNTEEEPPHISSHDTYTILFQKPLCEHHHVVLLNVICCA